MKQALLFCNLLFFFSSLNGQNRSNEDSLTGKDSIYCVTFLDLVAKDFVTGLKIKNNVDLVKEKRDIGEIVKKNLSRFFVIIPVSDTCLAKLNLDSTSRRIKVNVDRLCNFCSLKKRVIFVDATWTYLTNEAFSAIRQEHPISGINKIAWLTGTWWKIRVSLFDIKKNEFVYKDSMKFKQWGNVRPMRLLPGVGHRRFFTRSLEGLKKFLNKS
jgi:hypothetical protein